MMKRRYIVHFPGPGLGALSFSLVVISALAGCGLFNPGEGRSWKEINQDLVEPELVRQRDQALAAKDAMMGALMSRLMDVSGKEGTAAAIRVCKDEASEIAGRVAEEQGVTIGRTSFRLRNPENVPPKWAKDLVEERRAEPVYLLHVDGRLAAFLPIRLKPQCESCHGPKESIPEEVQARLAELYPNDEATGFTSGGLRGWFWVEVPPAGKT
jgi:hypothetical protein